MQQQVNIDLSQAENVGCEKCGHEYFVPVAMMKKLSAIKSREDITSEIQSELINLFQEQNN